MSRTKRSVSLPPELEKAVVSAADARGETFSAWLADAAWRKLSAQARQDEGLAAIEEFEAEHGPIPPQARADARTVLIAAGVIQPSERAAS